MFVHMCVCVLGRAEKGEAFDWTRDQEKDAFRKALSTWHRKSARGWLEVTTHIHIHVIYNII